MIIRELLRLVLMTFDPVIGDRHGNAAFQNFNGSDDIVVGLKSVTANRCQLSLRKARRCE
jgi:hypothetical protein